MGVIGVVGDVFVDRYWIGQERGLSAEAPIPIVDVWEKQEFPGGAANVVANLQALGRNSRLINTKQPPVEADWRVPIKNRLMAGDVQVARWDERDWLPALQREDLLDLLDVEAVIVSDYGKGTITDEIVEILAGVRFPIFVDTKKDPVKWIGSEAILFPNMKEYSQFKDHYDWLGNVVLKCGGEGMRYLQYGKLVAQWPSFAENVKCVNGAGDTVIAAFADIYCQTKENVDRPIFNTLKWSNAAAASVVAKPFTSTTTIEEIHDILARV